MLRSLILNFQSSIFNFLRCAQTQLRLHAAAKIALRTTLQRYDTRPAVYEFGSNFFSIFWYFFHTREGNQFRKENVAALQCCSLKAANGKVKNKLYIYYKYRNIFRVWKNYSRTATLQQCNRIAALGSRVDHFSKLSKMVDYMM